MGGVILAKGPCTHVRHTPLVVTTAGYVSAAMLNVKLFSIKIRGSLRKNYADGNPCR